MQELKPPPYLENSQKKEWEAPSQSGVGIYPYLQVLRNRSKVVLGCVLFTMGIAFVMNLIQRPVYQSSAELILGENENAGSLTNNARSFMEDPTSFLIQLRMVRSPHLAEKVLQRLERQENREPLLENFAIRPSKKRGENSIFSSRERSAILSNIQRSLSAYQPERLLRMINISATGYQPQMVARVTNAAAEAYVETTYQTNLDSFRQSFLMISKSLAEVREKIKAGEIALQKIDSEIRLLEAMKIYGERHPTVIELRTTITQLSDKLKREIQNLQTTQVAQRKDLVPLLTIPVTSLDEIVQFVKTIVIR